jgi:hypothetical protein
MFGTISRIGLRSNFSYHPVVDTDVVNQAEPEGARIKILARSDLQVPN